MKKTTISIFIITLLLYSCKEEFHQTIYLRNNNEINMVTVIVYNADRFECVRSAEKIKDLHFTLSSKETNSSLLTLTNDNWENKLKTTKLKVYFIIPDVFNQNICDTFKSKQMYTERLVTLDYLIQNNWTVSYP